MTQKQKSPPPLIGLIEKEASFANLIQKKMEKTGLKVTVCPNPSSIQSLLKKNPSIILAPQSLDSSSLKILKEYSSQDFIIPILAYTDQRVGQERENGISLGFDTVISKKSLENNPLWQVALFARPSFPPEMASAPLPKGIQEGIDLFNQRKFHESHDAIEAVWLHEPTGVRLLYQGILQVGISFYFVEKKNWNVALRMFRCCHLKIRHFLPKFQGIELLNLYQKTKKCEKIIKSLGPHRIHEFNFEEIPKISFRLPKG